MHFALKGNWWPIAILLLSLLQVDQAISDPCGAVKTELTAATKARDECLAKVQKTSDESCEGSKVAVNLRESLKKKDESLNQYVKKNSALNTELLECQEINNNNKDELQQHEKRKALLDKRLMATKEKLTKCEDQVTEFGPDDATAAQQEIVFLHKQVKTLQDTNAVQYMTIGEVQKSLNELRIIDAVCQSNYTNLEKDHANCNMSQGAIAQDYEILRTLLEYRNIILSVVGTFLVGLLLVYTCICYGHGHHPPPHIQQDQEEFKRQFIRATLPITGVPQAIGMHGGAPLFDVTFVRPETVDHQIWLKQIEQNLAPHDVTVNPQKLTEYDAHCPPPSKSVIFMSVKPEGSKFFCINQAKKEYFHIADNKELIEYAEKKYERGD
ncbi:uncharacterized protein LOC135499669 [Lineus longissimus]|uniref:uncharacterized protein LOC135499669 n=1 Tax=Lineus longissimus TaxID=88925 RepID=UPI002B4DF4FD